jgi:putative ABC transport system ATP-binding protein
VTRQRWPGKRGTGGRAAPPGAEGSGELAGSPPRADGALLRTSGLVKVYRADGVAVQALRGVDFELAAGEFVAVMGPSGSGKSTLLHVLGGLEPATSGEIWLRGQRVDRLSTAGWAVLRRRHVGFVFQFFNLLSNMTVADNVELPALLAGATPRQARKRREELLAELGIADKAAMAPARLSGGEQQRVALARALANEPSLLLADEPTGNLDSSNTRDVLRLLRRAHAGGQAILMVTHDARVASLADRVINLFDGMVADDAKILPLPRSANGVADVLELRG